MYLANKHIRRKTSTEYLLPALTPKKRQTSGMIFLQIIWGHQRWGSTFSSWPLGRLNNARTLLSEPRKSVIKAPLLNNNYWATDTLILKRKKTGPQENGDEVFLGRSHPTGRSSSCCPALKQLSGCLEFPYFFKVLFLHSKGQFYVIRKTSSSQENLTL